MKILICTSEYYPQGSGIANVAYNVVEKLKKKGITCEVCSPVGPDIKLGSEIKYGRLSLLTIVWSQSTPHPMDRWLEKCTPGTFIFTKKWYHTLMDTV